MIKKGKESPCYIDRTGEIHVTNQGEIIEILETLGHSKNIIKFSDGTIKENVAYNNIKSGAVEKPEERVGKQTVTNQGYTIEIINYVDSSNCTVLFLETENTKKTTFREFVTKTVTNPLHRGVYNVGFEGIGLYDFKSNKKRCRVWSSMLQRVYSNNYSAYKECTVDERWHNFQNFAKWFEENYNPETMEGWQLDKDILVKGNKIYSPETCCFVPIEINTIFKNDRQKGYNKTAKGNFIVRVNKLNYRETVGRFNTESEAFQAYKVEKEKYIKEVAEKWKELISDRVYQAMYNYQVEITY